MALYRVKCVLLLEAQREIAVVRNEFVEQESFKGPLLHEIIKREEEAADA